MALTLHNTAARQKQTFKPLQAATVSFYTCGPTVYAPAHIGNLRTFVVSDWLRQILRWNDYQVKDVMNVTDVDDKTIKASTAADISLADFTHQHEKAFFADLALLNVLKPEIVTHATEYINEMIAMIEKLLATSFAYPADDGIYFRVDKSENYGALAGLKKGLATQARIKNDEYDKETPSDFALWKFWQATDGGVGWGAPFGKGRPGWHIECSAMIRATLGDTIDIHLGGTDLIFPHHTNEIAQSEAVTGKSLANYWLHVAFVNMQGGKMAKSEGNVVTLADIATRGFSPLAYRYWLLSAHYRTLMNFSWEALEASATAYQKLRNRVADLVVQSQVVQPSVSHKPLVEYLNKFTEAINDDLNLPVAMSVVWQLLDDHSPTSPSASQGGPADPLATILEFDKVLGLDLASAASTDDISEIPEVIKKLLAEREEARKKEDWPRSDALRQEINQLGYHLEDTQTGPKIKLLTK